MKLLVISNNPDRASFRQRIEVYIDALKTNGIDCEIVKLPPGILSRRKLFLQAKDFDGVLLHKKILNSIDAHYLRKNAKKIIYDFDDAVMFDVRNPQKAHHKRRTSFKRTVSLADLVIAGNDYLAGHARKFNSNVEILPTGIDISAFKVPKPENYGQIRLVWIGSRPTLPNLKAIAPALENIGKSFQNVVLRVISDVFIDLKNLKVEKCPWSLKTEAAQLADSDIGLAPLDDNNFTRGKCGFKILQYAAAGLPTIASPVGVNSEIIEPGVNGFLAKPIDEWFEKISALINNKSLRLQMGNAARKSVASYDLNVLAPRLIALIKNAISR